MKYYLHNPGYIPGFPGVFPGNSIVEIDDNTHALLGVAPMFPAEAIVQPEAVDASPPPSSSASAVSGASPETDAAVLISPAQSSSPVPAPVLPQPPQQVIDLPENGG